eukprot:gene699-605_t
MAVVPVAAVTWLCDISREDAEDDAGSRSDCDMRRHSAGDGCFRIDAVRSTSGDNSFQNGSSLVQSDQNNPGTVPNGHVRPIADPNVVLLGGDPFDKQKYSDGLAAGGVDGLDLSDRAFYPEIYYEGAYHPICGIDFNDEAAATACRDILRVTEYKPDGGDWQAQERFTYGGRVVKMNMILEQDAMPVGACLKDEPLDSCTAGGNAFGDFTGLDGRCMKGNPVGVQIVCHYQCRKFGQRVWTEENKDLALQVHGKMEREAFSDLKICAPFLRNTSTYYLADGTFAAEWTWGGPSYMYQFATLLNVMNEECSANVVEFMCHSFFKECKEVEVEDPLRASANVFLPSLLCKTECERHKAMWDLCMAKIQTNLDDKKIFDSNMATMSEKVYGELSWFFVGEREPPLPAGPDGARSPFDLLDCDAKAGGTWNEIPHEEVVASWIFGRIPQNQFGLGLFNLGVLGWYFPRFMTSEMLYPEISSTYTGPDGVSHDVPCTIPGEADVFKTTCPDPFVDSVLPETNRRCVYACPVHQFSLEDYTTMWTVFVSIGMCSFILNVFMVCTWKLSGRRAFDALPFQLKACVFLGLLYGLVETIPTAILKFDLPCANETVEEVGNSAVCYLSRSGQYMLLGIMVNLCTLTISVHRALVNATSHESNMKVNVLTTTIPFLFMVIAYSLDTDSDDTENYHLNAVRHAFTCSMRFSTMFEEWLVLWLPFCVSGLLTAVFAIASWWKIGDIQVPFGLTKQGGSQVKSEGQKKLEGQRRRLIRIAATVSLCLLLNVGIVLFVTVQQSVWTEHEEKMHNCLTQVGNPDVKDYGFREEDSVKDVCMVPEEHLCRNIAIRTQAKYPIKDAPPFVYRCIWNPAITPWKDSSLICDLNELLDQYPEDHPVSLDQEFLEHFRYPLHCQCECSDLLPNVADRPSTFVMTLAFAAQSMVAAIVALNLGFREDNMDLWRTAIRTTFKSSTQIAATGDDFQFDSKAYEHPESVNDE